MPLRSAIFSNFLSILFFPLFSLGPLDPLTQHPIAFNNFLVIFVKIIIFVSFVDHLRLFVVFFFVTFVIECNPEHIS